MGQASVFIDGGYFRELTKFYGELSVDYESFSDALADPDDRFRTYLYDCPPWQSDPPTDEERRRISGYQKFKRALQYLDRFKIREGRLQRIGDDFRQKKVDIMLAVDAVKLAHTGKIDRAILVTSDSDFVPVIEAIDGTGVTSTLYYDPNLSYHNSLLETVDERFELSEQFLRQHLR